MVSKTGRKQTLDFHTSSEKPLSKLSENHKINAVGTTELKLWPFKDALFNATSTQKQLYRPKEIITTQCVQVHAILLMMAICMLNVVGA